MKKKEFWVGLFLFSALALLFVMVWLLGGVGSWTPVSTYSVLYRFAGGIDVGSAVRVAGIKVGKVDQIDFISESPDPADPVALKLQISVARRAAQSIREDSRFFVNMAGLIGERYIEISPGSSASPVLKDGATLRGIDPPRIDQLLSQGYGVFGHIQDFLERNEKTISDFIKNMDALLADANSLLKKGEGKKWVKLLDNLSAISSDLRAVTGGLNDEETKEFFAQLRTLMRRAHEVDGPVLRKFLQEEGIRARIF